MCMGFPDCPEWGAGEERSINVLLIQRSKEKLLCSLHCQWGLSCLKASGFALHHWHEMKAKLLTIIKTVAQIKTSTKEVLPFPCTCCAPASESSWLKISGDLGASTEHDAVPRNPGMGLPEALEAAQQSQQGNPLWLGSWMLH